MDPPKIALFAVVLVTAGCDGVLSGPRDSSAGADSSDMGDGPAARPEAGKSNPDGPGLDASQYPEGSTPKSDGPVTKPDAKPPKPLACTAQGGTLPVSKPVLVKNIPNTGTSWFGGAAMVDLDGDGKKELVGAFYDLLVWDKAGKLLSVAKSGKHHDGRIYAPAVIADLDGDKTTEIVVGAKKRVAAYQ